MIMKLMTWFILYITENGVVGPVIRFKRARGDGLCTSTGCISNTQYTDFVQGKFVLLLNLFLWELFHRKCVPGNEK